MLFSPTQLHHTFIKSLAFDPIEENYCRQVNAAFSFVTPKKTEAPELVLLNQSLAQDLEFATQDKVIIANVLTGNTVEANMKPFAMCYGGHQFGHWAGQLGDGRAINLAQIQTAALGSQTIQLKGAGPTPYSRTADGLAVLRSSVREFLCSEAMFHLGIPTTRALSLSLTGDKVMRDMFYDGNAQEELGAVVCRVSSSFIRFGSFQLPANRNDLSQLKQLIDYSLKYDFPECGEPEPESYTKWFNEIAERTCQLMVHWMRVGFVHGVMNTDNMSIIGETIDYGPYGWIDDFDLNWTPNTTDAQGKRYRFGAQPQIAQWNLFQLANAIYPLIKQAEPLNQILSDFAVKYEQQWAKMMADKLGFDSLDVEQDAVLFEQLEKVLSDWPTDMTILYRLLATLPYDESSWKGHLAECFYQTPSEEHWLEVEQWLSLYQQRLTKNEMSDNAKIKQMNAVNPKFVLRNYLTQQAIEKAEQGDYSMLEQLYQALQQPYDELTEFEHFTAKRPDWAKNKAGCSMLSCSS